MLVLWTVAAAQVGSRRDWVGQFGLLSFAGLGVAMIAVSAVAVWQKAAGRVNPLIATAVWGVALGILFALLAVDFDYVTFISRKPLVLALAVGLWAFMTGIVYLRFRYDNQRRS